jgi:Photosynthetic reaction centre cytochrome C subunit
VLSSAFLAAVLNAQQLSERQQPVAAPASNQSEKPQSASAQEINDRYVQRILQQIAGHEQEPAEKVFKNVQFMRTTPAVIFLRIMNAGFSRALGVTCTHCHIESDFSSDEKREKKAAREMQAMHRSINEQLNKMQNLSPSKQGRFINCSTCHRGAVDPLKVPEIPTLQAR